MAIESDRVDVRAFADDPYAPEFAAIRARLLRRLREEVQEQPIVSRIPASLPASAAGHPSAGHTGEVASPGSRSWEPYVPLKRLLDLVGGTALLLVASPVWLIAVAAVRLTSPGPVVVRMRREGRGGRAFLMCRFRTTRLPLSPEEAYSSHLFEQAETRVGKLLRRTKMQRLPELINVITGDMSLVGPRARHPWFWGHLTPESRTLIQSVRPGVTGPTQLRFRYERRLLARQGDNKVLYYTRVLLPAQQRLEQDYVREQSLRTDLNVLWKTWLVTTRNFTSRNGRVLADWMREGGHPKALLGDRVPGEDVVAEFYMTGAACMYRRQWEAIASRTPANRRRPRR